MRKYLFMAIALVALASLVRWSSSWPDTVQRVAGLRGGRATLVKAISGILVVGVLAAALGRLVARRNR